MAHLSVRRLVSASQRRQAPRSTTPALSRLSTSQRRFLTNTDYAISIVHFIKICPEMLVNAHQAPKCLHHINRSRIIDPISSYSQRLWFVIRFWRYINLFVCMYVYWNRGHGIQVRCQNFDRKLENSSFVHAQYKFGQKQPRTTGERSGAFKLQCVVIVTFSCLFCIVRQKKILRRTAYYNVTKNTKFCHIVYNK